MHLIILMLCLVIDRYTQVTGVIQNYRWLPHYVAKIQQLLGKTFLWKAGMPVIFWLLPIVLIIGLIQLILSHVLWGVLGYLFNFVVLLYCLGPSCFKNTLGEYFTAMESDDTVAAAKALMVTEEQATDSDSLSRSASAKILALGNRKVLGLILWFLVFGAIGVVLYKLVDLLFAEAEHPDSLVTPFKANIQFWMDVLDWVPVRVTALLYALAGSFAGSFNLWWNQLFTYPRNNSLLLEACGLAALHVTEDYQPKELEIAAQALVDRSITVALVIVALMTMAALIS